MQTLLTEGKLLKNGKLAQAGYSTYTARKYSRKDIKSSKWKIKEWDYYIVTDGKKAVALTVADNGYMSLVSASFLNFEKPEYKTSSEIKFFSFGKIGMPSQPENGDVLLPFETYRYFVRKKRNFANAQMQILRFLG